jgi:hypothetical protein
MLRLLYGSISPEQISSPVRGEGAPPESFPAKGEEQERYSFAPVAFLFAQSRLGVEASFWVNRLR